MSDIPGDLDQLGPGEEAPRTLAQKPAALEQFQSSLEDGAQDWGSRVSTILHDYLVRNQIATDNAQMGQQFVDSINAFKETLAGTIRANPAATDMALDVAKETAQGIANSHPFITDEGRQPLGEALHRELGNDLARTGIMAAAQRDETTALGMIAKYVRQGFISEAEAAPLEAHAGILADARQSDDAGATVANDIQKAKASTSRMLDYLGHFTDENGLPRIPTGGFNQKIINDQVLSNPAEMAALQERYNKSVKDRLTTKNTYPAGLLQGTSYSTLVDALNLIRGGMDISHLVNYPGMKDEDTQMLGYATLHTPEAIDKIAGRLESYRGAVLGKDGSIDAEGYAYLDHLAQSVLKEYHDNPGAFANVPRGPPVRLTAAQQRQDPAFRSEQLAAIMSQKQLTREANAPEKAQAEAKQLAEFNARQALERTRVEQEEQRRAETRAEQQTREAHQEAIRANAEQRAAQRLAEEDARSRRAGAAGGGGRGQPAPSPADAFRRGFRMARVVNG